jgi:hypothetical protein
MFFQAKAENKQAGGLVNSKFSVFFANMRIE